MGVTVSGCGSRNDLPQSDAPLTAARSPAHFSVDLREWPFGAAERLYPLKLDESRGTAFLKSAVRQGLSLPPLWHSRLKDLGAAPALEQLIAVNDLVNTLPYRRSDGGAWKPPSLFLKEGGDCNCFALTKYVVLRGMGYRAEDLRITAVEGRAMSAKHAVLLVRAGGGKFETFVLDNAAKNVRTALYAVEYTPLVSMNENGVWVHQANADDVLQYMIDPPVHERRRLRQ